MFALIKQFFDDAEFFKACISTVAGSRWVRGALLGLAAAIAGGQIPLGGLLGSKLYWAVPFIMAGAGSIAAGEKNVPIAQLKEQLEKGDHA